MSTDLVLADDAAPHVRRLTLNRPDKRNALSNPLRGQLFTLLRQADADRGVHVIVIRGAGPSFCAGYDLAQDSTQDLPQHQAILDGFWSRSVVAGWFEMWDYATPVIGQVHGHCLAGGTELAAACDLLYVAEDANIGYPPVRMMSPPDMAWQPWYLGARQAMYAVLTGDGISGVEAVQHGFANAAFSAADLDREVLAVAERVAKVPKDLLALNKRSVHRSMEVMGIRTAVRAGADIQALGFHQPSARAYLKKLAQDLNAALDERDTPFGDYRGGREP